VVKETFEGFMKKIRWNLS